MARHSARGDGHKRMIVSHTVKLTSPESTTLSISTLFWTSLLSLLIALLISFSKNFAMVRAFSVSSGILFPLISAILRQSRVSRKDSDLREFVRVTGASYAPLFSPLVKYCILKSNASSSREARRYLDKHLRLDIALQSYMNNRENAQTPSSTDLEKIFNKYKGVQFVLCCAGPLFPHAPP